MTSFKTALIAISILFTVQACNTIEGAGKDLENGGEAVQDAAK